jgi:hypothetical protein
VHGSCWGLGLGVRLWVGLFGLQLSTAAGESLVVTHTPLQTWRNSGLSCGVKAPRARLSLWLQHLQQIHQHTIEHERCTLSTSRISHDMAAPCDIQALGTVHCHPVCSTAVEAFWKYHNRHDHFTENSLAFQCSFALCKHLWPLQAAGGVLVALHLLPVCVYSHNADALHVHCPACISITSLRSCHQGLCCKAHPSTR